MPDDMVPDGPEGPSPPDSVQCPICEDEFDDEEALAEHITEEHG